MAEALTTDSCYVDIVCHLHAQETERLIRRQWISVLKIPYAGEMNNLPAAVYTGQEHAPGLIAY